VNADYPIGIPLVLAPELLDWVLAYEAEEKRLGIYKEPQMGRHAKDSGGGDFKQAPTGNHVARCIRLIDLGTQHGEYQGQPNVRNQVLITWELCNEPMDDGKPFTVSHFYTNSLNEKATMRAHLESWRGRQFTEEECKGFDLNNVLGKPCMLTVIANEKGKAKVSAVGAMPKGLKAPEPVNPVSSFWIEEWDQAAYDALPKGIKDIIEKSDEYKARTKGNGKSHFDDMKDDIPGGDVHPIDVPF
jgi:hypothetical protein